MRKKEFQPCGRIGIAEFSAKAGVHPKTTRRWIAEGRISAVRLGPRLIQIDPAELDRITQPVGGAAA
jgi:excisionase family DNA binding protein